MHSSNFIWSTVLYASLGKSENHLSNLNRVMRTEYRIAIRSSLRNDFVEGVRAVLVDKDKNPKWNPSRLEDVDWTEIQSLFEPLGTDEDELRL
ncbi:3-hydroxyisobutyryl-CoA hydrolase [Ranunculus cassubicifolius]